jgi:hypothetical protein
MKTRFAASIRLPLMAGALALFVAGCGSMDHHADRSASSMDRHADRMAYNSGYAGQSGTPGIPPSIDPFSSRYIPFPSTTNESSNGGAHSAFCVQHYNQPGCQSGDPAGTR